MDLKSFIKQNRNDWNQLELTIKSMRRLSRITPEVLENFQLLYQKATHHLSYAQTYYPADEVTFYLNELVAKAHNMLYRDQVTSLQQIRNFFSNTFIQLFVEHWRFIAIAFVLFLIGATGGFISVMNDQSNLYTILPSNIANAVDPNQLGNIGEINNAQVSASIMTNNITVAFQAFAGGITLGLLTVFSLVYNGIILGALAALFLQHDKFYDFWAYILPHGIIELTAIFIAGGSGLLMAYRILVPGPYPRSFQLKRQALRSVQLLLGTIPLFIIAGIIEGYITPSSISLGAKYAFSLFTIFLLVFYITIGYISGNRKNKTTKLPD